MIGIRIAAIILLIMLGSGMTYGEDQIFDLGTQTPVHIKTPAEWGNITSFSIAQGYGGVMFSDGIHFAAFRLNYDGWYQVYELTH